MSGTQDRVSTFRDATSSGDSPCGRVVLISLQGLSMLYPDCMISAKILILRTMLSVHFLWWCGFTVGSEASWYVACLLTKGNKEVAA